MVARCPYLGLVGNRHQVFVVASSRHRCYVQSQPERIGSAHQAGTCLTSAYRRCPRFIAAETARERLPRGSQLPQPDSARARRLDLDRSPSLTVGRGQASQIERAEPHRPSQASSAGAGRPRRLLTMTELVVSALVLSIVLSCSFIGYALLHRLRVGPGMTTVPQVVELAGQTPPRVLPTLVPTFTPPPSPTVPLPTMVAGAPTSIPEPALPMTAPASRPPATSPPTRLVIPSINLDIPVMAVGIKTVREGNKSKLVWADLPYAGGFHQTSSYPGHPGNTVINGHRDIYGAVFRHLDQLEVGDEIILYVNEIAYPYLVTETLVVPETFASAQQRAENLRLIGFMPEERLTLVTCTPVGLATHRLLVIAKPPDHLVPQMPEAGR